MEKEKSFVERIIKTSSSHQNDTVAEDGQGKQEQKKLFHFKYVYYYHPPPSRSSSPVKSGGRRKFFCATSLSRPFFHPFNARGKACQLEMGKKNEWKDTKTETKFWILMRHHSTGETGILLLTTEPSAQFRKGKFAVKKLRVWRSSISESFNCLLILITYTFFKKSELTFSTWAWQ